jgi:superfamily II DNA/RNA helicase
VTHVFNYDVPHHADDYVHRIGRTGRAGKSGVTYMLATPSDSRGLDKVLKLIGKAPEEVKLDLDYSGVKPETRAKGDRGRGRDAKEGRSRGRPASETSVAAMEPLTPTLADPPAPAPKLRTRAPDIEPAAPAKPPRRAERAPRPSSRPAEAPVPVAAAERAPERPAPAERRRGVQPVAERDDDDRRVVGFGSDLPAFLAKPISVRSSRG